MLKRSLALGLFVFMCAGFRTEAASCPQGHQEVAANSSELSLKPCLKIKDLYLSHLTISDASLSSGIFTSVDFFEAVLKKSAFVNTEFTTSALAKVKGQELNFQGTQWRGGSIKDSQIKDSNFAKAAFKGTRWIRSDFSNSSFRDVQASNCYLEKINLEDTDLRGAQFNNCTFIGVSLRRATFNRSTVLPISEAAKSEQGMVYKP